MQQTAVTRGYEVIGKQFVVEGSDIGYMGVQERPWRHIGVPVRRGAGGVALYQHDEQNQAESSQEDGKTSYRDEGGRRAQDARSSNESSARNRCVGRQGKAAIGKTGTAILLAL